MKKGNSNRFLWSECRLAINNDSKRRRLVGGVRGGLGGCCQCRSGSASFVRDLGGKAAAMEKASWGSAVVGMEGDGVGSGGVGGVVQE